MKQYKKGIPDKNMQPVSFWPSMCVSAPSLLFGVGFCYLRKCNVYECLIMNQPLIQYACLTCYQLTVWYRMNIHIRRYIVPFFILCLSLMFSVFNYYEMENEFIYTPVRNQQDL